MKSPRQNKPRRTLLSVDLRELKEPWAGWCERRHLTPSEAVRQVLSVVLKGKREADELPTKPLPDGLATDKLRRLQIKLTATEHAGLVSLANREGMTVPRWLKGLIRLHLTGDQQFGEAEIEALARSSQVLLALGRSINQIGRNMSGRTDSDVLTLAQLKFLGEQIKTHTDAVSALLNANSTRWRR